MSFLKGAFSVKKAKPRKHISRSPLKLHTGEFQQDMGPKCEAIDVKVAKRKIVFDIQNGDWVTVDVENLGETSSRSVTQPIRKEIEMLHEENNMLKLKVEVLLNLVGERLAELSTSQD